MTKCIHCGLTLADPPNGEEGCGAPQIDTSPEGRSSAYKDFSRPVLQLTGPLMQAGIRLGCTPPLTIRSLAQ